MLNQDMLNQDDEETKVTASNILHRHNTKII